MTVDPSMRAGDRDRDAVVDVLHQAHAEGRLGLDELNARLDRALTARTYGELVPLTEDLPTRPDAVGLPAAGSTGARAAGPVAPRPTHHVVARGLKAVWSAWALAVTVNVVIWLILFLSDPSDPPYFWPMWVAGPWGAVLLVSTVAARRSGD